MGEITVADVELVESLIAEQCPGRGLKDLDLKELENLKECMQLDYYDRPGVVAVAKMALAARKSGKPEKIGEISGTPFEERKDPDPFEPDPQDSVALVKPEKSLVPRIDGPLPEHWDYDESVKKSRGLVASFKSVSVEMLREFWVAREMLRNQGARSDLTSGQLSRGWESYCAEVGILKRTANRWLAQFDEKTGRKLEAPKQEKPAEEFRPRKVSGNYRRYNRPGPVEYRPVSKFEKVVRFYSGVENEIDAIEEGLDEGIPELSLELAAESSEGHDVLERLEILVSKYHKLGGKLEKLLELQRGAVYG